MPDPLGPLFDALEAINAELTAFAARLARLEDGNAGRARSSPGQDDEGSRAPGSPIVWHEVPEEQRGDLWGEFVAWVIRTADQYELTTEQLPRACWWEHASVVAELTALWTGWQSAHASEDDAQAGPYLWQDAWSRGIERIGRTWLGECTNGYHSQRSRMAWGTDPGYRRKVLEAGPPGVAAVKPQAR